MAKRDKPALPDWHLWSEVAQTVSPLHRTRIREALKLREQPLPLPKTPPGPRHKPVKLPPPMPSYQSSCKPGRQANLERIFALFPRLRERSAQAAGTLSGGEQQMLAIGRGLMGEPKLIILDEPSLGLSPLLVEEMFTLIARIAAEGLAVMLVEQNVVQSLELASRAYVMENGRIVVAGAAAEIGADPALKHAYLGL